MHNVFIEEVRSKKRENNSLNSDRNKEMIDEAIQQVKICMKSFQNVRKSAHRQPKLRNNLKVHLVTS